MKRAAVLLAAIALTAYAGTPQPPAELPPAELPPELPHYPCQRQEAGKTVYFACSADEWLYQIITRKEHP